MVTIDELKNLDRSKFTKAADGWGLISNRAGAARERVDQQMTARLQGTQKGDAATAALENLDTLTKNYQYIHAECGLIRTALSGLAEELEAPQRKLQQALEDAEGMKFTVKPDGSVEYPKTPSTPAPLLPTPAAPGVMPSLLKPDSTPDPNQTKAQEIANRIGDALKEASDIDVRYTRALAKLTTNSDLANTDWSDVAHDVKDVRTAAGKHFSESKIPKGKSPKENAKWWANLSSAEQDEYAALYPASIGAMDGLPAAIRDGANRIVLTESREDLLRQLSSLDANQPEKLLHFMRSDARSEVQISPKWEEWKSDREQVSGKLDGMNAIQRRLDLGSKEDLPEAYLLGFDIRGNGHAIVANGNPDSAANTAVYVPGTTARLTGIDGDIKRMTRLWAAGRGMPGSPDLSTVTWLGYDAPQSIVPEATSEKYAHSGAPRLNNFLDGLQTAQGGPGRSHTTVIGHSYGSTVVGDASNKGHLAADDIIVAGSPGMLVKEADDLDVGKGHVWSEAASVTDDQVPLGGRVVGLGGYKMGVQTWHGIPYNVGLQQTVPSDEAFGANRMTTDSDSHSHYWEPDSVSLRNQAAVVVGQYKKVELE